MIWSSIYGLSPSVLEGLYYVSYFFVPLFLINTLWEFWVRYRRALYFAKQTYVLLEIKLPREIFKSPRAMEFCIAGMWQMIGEGNWFEKYWKGMVRAHFSLEIVSIDGVVHFYIYTKKGHKNQVEANLYSQYPGIEIYEVSDYSIPFRHDPEVSTFWACEFELSKADAFPIKTYIDYGMEKDPKEEFKIDPMTPFIEFIGSLPRGNNVWLQFIIRAHKAEEKDRKKTFRTWKIWETWKMKDVWDFMSKKDYKWKEAAQEEIDKIIAGTKGEKDKDGKFVPGTGRQPTEIEKETIAALGRSISKNGFDVGMRLIYTAPKDVFVIMNLAGIIGGIAHFNSHLNGFKTTNGSAEYHKHFLLSWWKRSERVRNVEQQNMLDAYKRRAFFYWPYKREKTFVLNSEELATVFHLPGGVASTPSFTRIESRKAEPPANLPV
ncbi:MAG TPA: hypothetical protein VJG67_01705 [Candidatus Paceibacterota bacterium]